MDAFEVPFCFSVPNKKEGRHLSLMIIDRFVLLVKVLLRMEHEPLAFTTS